MGTIEENHIQQHEPPKKVLQDKDAILISGNTLKIIGAFSTIITILMGASLTYTQKSISSIIALNEKADKKDLALMRRQIEDHRVEISSIKIQYSVKLDLLRELKSEIKEMKNDLKTIRLNIGKMK